MTSKTLVAILVVFCAFGRELPGWAQSQNPQLSLEAFFIEPPKAGGSTLLWLRIVNSSSRPQVVCRTSWGYTWLSDDPQDVPVVKESSSLHGCGGSLDPLWLLLPNESRFDSYQVSGPARPEATLSVDVEVMRQAIGVETPREQAVLSWKGTVAEAIAMGARLKAEK